MKTLFKNTYISRTTEAPRPVVLDIQYRAHFIAILCLESTIIKIDIAHHFGVDETQTFLLATAYEIRTEDLEIINIDQVLIITTAPYIVLLF